MATESIAQEENGGSPVLLDLFSTSATPQCRCVYKAPYLYIPGEGGKAQLFQGCCNHWDCPRCGQMRAKYEYGRLVEGARKLTAAGVQLWMMTITCRGDVSLDTAEREYGNWTKRFNDAVRLAAKRRKDAFPFAYAAVLERQERLHPHSHYITSFVPSDALHILSDYANYVQEVWHLNERIEATLRYSARPLERCSENDYFSAWLQNQCVLSGLGVQCDTAMVDTVEGASRYVAKYLFKNLRDVTWPENWKRVRYSHNWPKLPDIHTRGAFAVLSRKDWQRVVDLNERVECFGVDVLKRALRHQVARAFCVQKDGTVLTASNVDERQGEHHDGYDTHRMAV